MYQNIVVPLDSSEMAEKILPYLRHLVLPKRSRLIVVSCVEPQKYAYAAFADEPRIYAKLLGSVEQETRDYLTLIKKKLEGEGYTVETRIAHGDAAQFIIDVASEEEADLVAMTTHGRTGFARWVLGSVADRVVRAVQCPVLLLRGNVETREPFETHKILVPLDGSQMAEKALVQAKVVARETESALVLLRVIGPLSRWERQILYSPDLSFDAIAIHRSDEAREYLEAVGATLNAEGIDSQPKVYTGTPAESILDAVEKNSIDLVVMSTHGYGGYTRWMYGSVASQLLHSAPCPLLIVRAFEEEEALDMDIQEPMLLPVL